MPTVAITVRGHVQGVGFRWALRAEAERVGVTGWVRNRRDGSVEAHVSGAQGEIDEIVAWAHHGPPLARVERVEIAGVRDAEDGTAFEIRASA
ncbi:acylphosphatase [Microbacterium enclense]|uniref:acylphosphatase n=1 Tax=Microbacterium enclense TaxID=993073 RepID=UPI0021A5BB34|nr:acylphosphatase [Microbacterium enclense]MCT2087399.1 acylphosphatase [Microbacterium enclense]